MKPYIDNFRSDMVNMYYEILIYNVYVRTEFERLIVVKARTDDLLSVYD